MDQLVYRDNQQGRDLDVYMELAGFGSAHMCLVSADTRTRQIASAATPDLVVGIDRCHCVSDLANAGGIAAKTSPVKQTFATDC